MSTNQTEALIYREIALRVPIKSRIIISTPPGSPFQPWDWRSRQLLVSHGCAAEVYRVEPWAVWVWNWGAIGGLTFVICVEKLTSLSGPPLSISVGHIMEVGIPGVIVISVKKAIHIAVHIAVEFLFFPPFLGLFRYEGILGIRNCPRKALNQSLRFGGTAFLEVNQFLLAPCVFVLSQFCDA